MLTPDGKLYHIHCKPGDVGRYVLLPGDPFRTDLIASYFDDARLVAHNRDRHVKRRQGFRYLHRHGLPVRSHRG